MTLSPLAVLHGVQQPRVASVPPAATTAAGEEAVELAAAAGLFLDPWQRSVLLGMMGERADGRWAAFEAALLVPRQNGKNAVIEAREMYALFLSDDTRLTIHSAHQFDTSLEAFSRLLALIEGCPDLDREVAKVQNSHGEEGIRLRNGHRIRYRTRTKGGGRGFTGDLLVLDEAQKLATRMFGALLPTLSARPNAQVIYTGTVPEPGDEDGQHFAGVRDRGRAGNDPSLAWWEWNPGETWTDLDDRAAWALANPALGIRITAEAIERERRAQPGPEGEAEFLRERLCVWPPGNGDRWQVITEPAWSACRDPKSKTVGPPTFALDLPPSRESAVIGLAAARADGVPHVELVDQRPGTRWVVARCAELKERWRGRFVVDAAGPAASFIPDLEANGVEVVTTTARDMAAACGTFYDAVQEQQLRHLGDPVLNAAVEAAGKRTLGDAWAWNRRDPNLDISPLVAVTLALHGHLTAPPSGGPNLW